MLSAKGVVVYPLNAPLAVEPLALPDAPGQGCREPTKCTDKNARLYLLIRYEYQGLTTVQPEAQVQSHNK